MRGNPWPHDMVIRVQNNPQGLLTLLWIREAWGLGPTGDDLPPALADTPQPARSADDRLPDPEWATAWPELWHAGLVHAGTPRDEAALQRLIDSEPGSPERARLVHEQLLVQMQGLTWQERFGDAAITDGYREWSNSVQGMPGRHLDDRERAVLSALIPAWQAGLTQVVELPCVGSFTRVIGPHALLMTAQTRADDDRYREALGSFR